MWVCVCGYAQEMGDRKLGQALLIDETRFSGAQYLGSFVDVSGENRLK
jgi:hypothetical protein